MNLITGYYGFKNFGDDLFVAVMENYCTANNINYHIELSNNGKFSKFVTRIFKIDESSSITLAGGSILGNVGGLSVRNFEKIIHNFKKNKYSAIGVGLHNSDNIDVGLIAKMGFIGIRSKKDYNIVKKLNSQCYYTSDLAYAYDIKEIKNNKKKSLGIIITEVGFLGSNIHNLDKIMHSIKDFFDKDIVINVYIFQSIMPQDITLGNLICSKINEYDYTCEVFIHETVEKTICSLSKNLFIISDRLHGAILSHKLNIPFLMSVHHEKCKDFLTDINYSIDEANLKFISPFSFEKAINYSLNLGIIESNNMTELSLNGLNMWNDFLSN